MAAPADFGRMPGEGAAMSAFGDKLTEFLAEIRANTESAWAQIDGFRKEVRDLRAATLPDNAPVENFFAKSGLPEFLDGGNDDPATAKINMLALSWLQGVEKDGANPSAALLEYLQEQIARNDILRAAKDELAALTNKADFNLRPDELRPQADEWEKKYRAAMGDGDQECADAIGALISCLRVRAREIELARPVRMGGDYRTGMTGAEVKRLRDCRGAIVAAAANPPRGLFPPDLRDEWRTRPDLLGLMLSVYLRVPPVNEDGKTFADGSAGAFQIRGYRGGRTYALHNAGRGWEKPGADIFAVAGKLIGREKKEDFPAQAAAVDALIKNARGQNPNALADLREWDSPVSAVAAQISDDKKCYRKISEISAPVARGQTALLRALTPDDVGQCGAGIVGIINLANPTKKDGANRLAGMSDKDIKAAAAAAGGGKSAGYHAFRFLHDSGLLERLRRVRKFWEWTDCIRALKDHAAQSRRWARLRAALCVWWNAWQEEYGRFADCIQPDRHSICAQAKAARCGRDTMRKMRRTLASGGKLSALRNACDFRCVFYRLVQFPRMASNAVFNALGKTRRKASENIAAAAFASRHILPLATAPPLR